MEANKINEAPVEAAETATGKSRMSKGQMVGMAVLTIVALAGVAFGVWGMVGKDQAEKNLAIKITEAGGKITEMVTDKITSIAEDGTVTEIVDTITSAVQAVNTEDYIYIGEWGIKIKIPEGLKDNISYIFNGESIEIIGESGFGVDKAVISSGIPYMKMTRSKVGEVDFKGCEVSCSNLFATIGGFDYHGMIIFGENLDSVVFDGLKEMSQASSFSVI